MQGTSDGSTADDGTGRGASGFPGSPGAPAGPDSPGTPASPAAPGSPDAPGGASGQGRRFRLRGPRTPEGGRRMAAVAWVCAVAAAFLLGAWSFAQVDQGDRYQRLDPLDEASVHHELAQSRKRTGAGPDASLPPGSTDPSGGSHSTATAPSDDDHDDHDGDDDDDDEHDDHDEHGDHDEDDEDGGGAGSGDASAGGPAHVSTVRFPEGLGTAVAECRSGTRTVTLLSWSPAQGYSADDVEPGPTRTATVELERASDDSDDGDDRTVAVECVHGKPHTSLHKDSDDDGDDEDD
ncbi:hypothetical protein [Streptomyces cacaoi]|uniref:hypothetical protein n=1 Tax=Streptomyces cacaoi TaxID=1898 RepID=UPI0033283950